MTSLASFLAAAITAASSARAGRAQTTPKAMAADAAQAPRPIRPIDPGSSAMLCRNRDGAGHRAEAERGGHEQRVNAGTSGHHDIHVLRLVSDADAIGIAHLREPARAAMTQAFDRTLAEAVERDARPPEHGLADLRLADPVMRQRGGV